MDTIETQYYLISVYKFSLGKLLLRSSRHKKGIKEDKKEIRIVIQMWFIVRKYYYIQLIVCIVENFCSGPTSQIFVLGQNLRYIFIGKFKMINNNFRKTSFSSILSLFS